MHYSFALSMPFCSRPLHAAAVPAVEAVVGPGPAAESLNLVGPAGVVQGAVSQGTQARASGH